MEIAGVNSYRDRTVKDTSFKADICFVNRRTFYKLKKELNKPFWVGGLIDGVIKQAAVKAKNAYTTGDIVCTVGSLFNTDSKLVNMFHLSPKGKTLPHIQEVKEIIFSQAKNLRDCSSKNLQGLLLGSDANHLPDKYPKSISLREEILSVFNKISKDLGMDFSVIMGRLNPYTQMNLISDPVKNTQYIWIKGLNSNSVSEVAKNYEIKRISPRDRVFFNGQDCTEEFVRTDPFKF